MTRRAGFFLPELREFIKDPCLKGLFASLCTLSANCNKPPVQYSTFEGRLHIVLSRSPCSVGPCLAAGCCALHAARHRIRPCGPLVISAPPLLRVLLPACPRRRSSCAASCGRTGPGRGWRGGRAPPPGSWAASPASPASHAAVQMQMGCPARAATRATAAAAAAAAAAALQPVPQSPPLPPPAAVG